MKVQFKTFLRVIPLPLMMFLFACSSAQSPTTTSTNTAAGSLGSETPLPNTPSTNAPSPVLQILATIPDTPEGRASYVTYVDFRAMENARLGAAHPKSWADWKALNAAEDPAVGLWNVALNGISSESVLKENMYQMENLPAILGFDWFAVNQSASYGNPLHNGLVLAGNFDAGAIDAALSKRGYTKSDLNGATLWCGPVGCENGMQQDFQKVDFTNPFGGNLGEQWPLLLQSGYLVGSRDFKLLQADADVIAGKQPSLAQAAAYRTAVEAITQSGLLIQANFVNPSLIQPMANSLCAFPNPASQAKCRDVERPKFVAIAPYHLLVLADTATTTEQLAITVLVYDTEADAQAAAATIPPRIAQYKSALARQSFGELVKQEGATVEATTYASPNTGNFATVIVFRAPLAPKEPQGIQLVPSSLVYKLLSDSLIRRDLGWLSVTFE